jgi:hypothetical protein
MDMSFGGFESVTRILHPCGYIEIVSISRTQSKKYGPLLRITRPVFGINEPIPMPHQPGPFEAELEVKIIIESVREPDTPVTVLKSSKVCNNGRLCGGKSVKCTNREERSDWNGLLSKRTFRNVRLVSHKEEDRSWKKHRVNQFREY